MSQVPTSPSMESQLLPKPMESSRPPVIRRVTKKLTRHGHSWLAEIIALVVSVMTLGAICILLPFYDGRPLAVWTFVLSLNTVVSILGATSRASMGFALSAAFGQEKWNWYRIREDRLLTFDRFDEATRGPLGSLKLLWHLKFRHWTAFGALAMTVLLGFEPFLQSLIVLEGRLVAVTPDEVRNSANLPLATISRSPGTLEMGRYMSDSISIPPEQAAKLKALGSSYNKTTGADWAASLASARFFSRPDFGLTAAIVAGLSSASNETNKASWNPSFSCPSGNCTWPPYTSLGLCSQCNDVSSNIRSVRGLARWCSYDMEPDCDSPVTIKYRQTGGLYPGYDVLNYTKHTLVTPKGANLSLSNWHIPYAGNDCPLCETATLVADTILSPDMTLTFQDMTTMIIAWVYMAADTSYSEGKTKWENTSVTAHECSLYFCTQALHSRVENGQLLEKVLGTWAQRRPLVPPPERLDIETQIWNQTQEKANFSDASLLPWVLSATGRSFGLDFGRNNSTMQLYIPRSELMPLLSNITTLNDTSNIIADQDLEFNITRSTVGALMRYLANDLSGYSARYYNPISNTTKNYNTQLIYPPDFYGNVQTNGPTPPIITSLGEAVLSSSRGANFSLAMENLAASMTKFIREYKYQPRSTLSTWSLDTAPDPEASVAARQPVQVNGSTQLWVLHIRVRWEYLALPAAVLLLGCGVVLAVILQSRRLNLPAWRGSSLVTLARGLDPESRERLRRADAEGKLRRKGREMRVSLFDGDGDADTGKHSMEEMQLTGLREDAGSLPAHTRQNMHR